MQRIAMAFLNKWITDNDRKPLLLQGARMVGKTWLVRKFAMEQGLDLIELNFKYEPRVFSFFESHDPNEILRNLGYRRDGKLKDLKKSLLFLDDIQVCPEILTKLRLFAKNTPELPVIASGVLLGLVFERCTFSMSATDINYLHLEPFSFEEFLLAINREEFIECLKVYQLHTPFSYDVHKNLMNLFKNYILVGGMPNAISEWITYQSLDKSREWLHNFIYSYIWGLSAFTDHKDVE